MSDNRPVALLDTGVGGVLIYKKLRERFPSESFVCLADACFLGGVDRVDSETTRLWAKRTALKLADEGECKALVIACNSAYIAGRELFETESSLPITGPVIHAARTAARSTRNATVGVVATLFTAKSGVYSELLRSLNPHLTVIEEGCPEWVQLVERAEDEPDIWTPQYQEEVLERHLVPLRNRGCDTIILGCTHFPALSERIKSAYGREVCLVDGAVGIVEWLEALFKEGRLERSGLASGSTSYKVTADYDRFQRLSRRLLNDESFTPSLDLAWPSQALMNSGCQPSYLLDEAS